MMATKAKVSFHITTDTLTPGLKEFPPKLDIAVARTVDYFAPNAESYMKQNAPWEDRTGNARNLLHATPFHEPPVQHGIVLAHGVPYGIWLEVRFEGRYSIIQPTIEAMGPEMMNTFAGLLSRM